MSRRGRALGHAAWDLYHHRVNRIFALVDNVLLCPGHPARCGHRDRDGTDLMSSRTASRHQSRTTNRLQVSSPGPQNAVR